jgi:hypothetical protein
LVIPHSIINYGPTTIPAAIADHPGPYVPEKSLSSTPAKSIPLANPCFFSPATQGNVKEATGVLQKEFYSKPQSLVLLIQVATGHEDPNLRQLSAVEARGLVQKHWLKVAAAEKPQVREQLLRATMGESQDLVRHSVARIISAIAKIDLQDGEWADLPNILLQAADGGNQDERSVAIYILFTILETLGEGFEEKFQDLFTLFNKTIRDPESAEVRINTLLALSKLAYHLDSEENVAPVKAFQEMVPAMVAVLKDAIDQNEEDRIMQAFEVFQTLLSLDPALLTVHLKDLVIFMNEISANTQADEDVRTQAISFLMQCVQYRKLKIQGMRLGEQLTRTALQIVTELDDSPADDDDITPPRSALGLLDILAQSLPPSQVVVPLLQSLGQYFHHTDPNYRRAGIMALGMCVEGAPDFISTQMKEIFPMVLQLLADPEPKVRQASLHAVARLADDLAEDLSAEHERLMPLLFKNLASAMQEYKGEEDGPTMDIMKAGISAIDAVVDGLDEKDVAPYQAELVPILHELFKHPDFKIKGLAAGALGSLASSAGDSFLSFFDESMHLLQEFATVKDSEEELDLRASVTDAMGEMSAAAGPERYQPYVEPLMRATEEALHLGHSRLKESTYIFWGAMAKVYGEQFSPFLDGVVKGLFECIEQDEDALDVDLGEAARDLIGQEVIVNGRKVKVASADDDDELDGDIEDVEIDEDDEDDWDDITATTPLSLEKEIAVEVIGDLVTHTRSSFLPYFEKTIETVMPLAEHPYEGVRKSTISTLHRSYAMLFAIAEESGQMPKWQAGLPLQVQPAKEVKKFGEILMTATIKMWAEEDDRYVYYDCFEIFAFGLVFYMMIFPLNPAHFDTPKSVIDANGDSVSDICFHDHGLVICYCYLACRFLSSLLTDRLLVLPSLTSTATWLRTSATAALLSSPMRLSSTTSSRWSPTSSPSSTPARWSSALRRRLSRLVRRLLSSTGSWLTLPWMSCRVWPPLSARASLSSGRSLRRPSSATPAAPSLWSAPPP